MYQERFRLDDRVAVVTGGGRGIGLACAEALAESGARLVILERDEAIGAAGRDELAARGHAAELVIGDVTDSARVTEIADELAARGSPATVLVDNAGIGETGVPSADLPDDVWQRTMNVNVNGLFFCCRAFARHMLAGGSGAIVNSARSPA